MMFDKLDNVLMFLEALLPYVVKDLSKNYFPHLCSLHLAGGHLRLNITLICISASCYL